MLWYLQNIPYKYFNPRPPYEGRHSTHVSNNTVNVISIHAPHTRGDGGGASAESQAVVISIHAPHTRGDCNLMKMELLPLISIHAPHTRGDGLAVSVPYSPAKFQSTPPIRGATSLLQHYHFGKIFQSTPPIRGATLFGCSDYSATWYFNPRPPYEGRLSKNCIVFVYHYFNPRPPYEGRHRGCSY